MKPSLANKQNPSIAAPRSRPLNRRACLFFYATLTLLCAVLHNRLVDSNAADARKSLHADVISNKAPAPLQYRIMTFAAAEGLIRAGRAFGMEDPFALAYLILRAAVTFFCAWALHAFLEIYVPMPWPFVGTLFYFAWLPLTYINYYMQETDPANMLFYLLAFFLIRSRRDRALAVLLPLSMLNRETPVLVPLIWLFYRWDELPPARTLARFAGFCAEAFGVYFALRFAFGEHAAYAEFNDLRLNFTSFNSYFYFFILFGAVWSAALWNFRAKPKFLRRAALFIPLFLVFHFVIPIFQETRLFLPIFPLVIALALTTWAETKPGVFEMENKSGGLVLARPGLWYAGLFAMFIAAMGAYLAYLEKAHVADLTQKQKAERFLKRGGESHSAGVYQEAARQWEWGLVYDPESYDLHFNLAAVYAERLFDADRAETHIAACRKISPDDPRLADLARRVEILRQERRRMF